MAGLPVTLRRALGARVFCAVSLHVGGSLMARNSGPQLRPATAARNKAVPHARPTVGAEVHPMKLFPGLTFSWKRALGITAAKRRFSRATGIPTSRSGRRAKLGRILGMK